MPIAFKLIGTAVVEGDIFHQSLAIEEHARFEGASRRKDHVVDASSNAQVNRPTVPNQDGTD
jgi:cytoskeletal protein CcmA (bactofilin family)